MATPHDRTRSAQGKRAVISGISLFLAAALIAALPLVWGRSSINKYFVAFGFFGACVGVSLSLHGAWDWWRGDNDGGRGRGGGS